MGDERSQDGEKQQASSGLLRVVWFRQMLHRWQSSSTATPATGTSSSASVSAEGTSTDEQSSENSDAAAAKEQDDNSGKLPPPLPAGSCRLPRVVVVDERRRPDAGPSSSPMTPEPPCDVPRGCCAVYVGAERRRFVLPTAYLGMPVFRRLLEKAEDEFGFDYHGAGITIPCDTEAFKYILRVMEAHQQGLVDDEGNPKEREEDGESSDTR